MILHVPEGQWADAVTALEAELVDISTTGMRGTVAQAFRLGLRELGLEVTVTTDKPPHRVVS